MTVKLVLLKSGETLVSDIKEGYCDDKLVCYILDNPFVPSVEDQYDYDDEFETDAEDDVIPQKYSISLYPWPPLSKDSLVEIPLHSVITLVDPIDEIKQMYERRVLKNESNKNIGTDEQLDSDQ